MSSRRWMAIILAAVAGFVGSGSALSPAALVTILAVLFVAVFLVALAISMVTEPSPLELERSEVSTGSGYAEASPVQGEAVYGSP
jgi:hypothetical protein